MRCTITSFWVCPTPPQTDRQTAEERSVNLRKRDTDAEHSFFLLTDFGYNLSAWRRAVRDLLGKHKSRPRLALGGLCFWLRHILTTMFYSSLVVESVYRREWDSWQRGLSKCTCDVIKSKARSAAVCSKQLAIFTHVHHKYLACLNVCFVHWCSYQKSKWTIFMYGDSTHAGLLCF